MMEVQHFVMIHREGYPSTLHLWMLTTRCIQYPIYDNNRIKKQHLEQKQQQQQPTTT